jgi:hypothetical protein
VRVRLDGIKVADSKADLTDGKLFAPMNLTETGVYELNNAWTGTNDNGTRSTNTCAGWSSESGTGTEGRAVQAGSGWSSLLDAACGLQFRLYCFEE